MNYTQSSTTSWNWRQDPTAPWRTVWLHTVKHNELELEAGSDSTVENCVGPSSPTQHLSAWQTGNLSTIERRGGWTQCAEGCLRSQGCWHQLGPQPMLRLSLLTAPPIPIVLLSRSGKSSEPLRVPHQTRGNLETEQVLSPFSTHRVKPADQPCSGDSYLQCLVG